MNFNIRNEYIDNLTGIPNRDYLYKYYEENKNFSIGLAFLDYDNFKYINDVFGHNAGDKVLKNIAEILTNLIKDKGMVFRFGGDEFLLLFLNKETKFIENIVNKIIDFFNEIFIVDGIEILTTVSAGLYMAKQDEDIEEIIRKADAAMYASKNDGKSKLTIFDKKIEDEIKRKSKLIVELKKAIQKNEFYVLYQPIYDINSNKIKQVEALARWKNDRFGEIPPSEFIPLLEETELIREFGINLIEKIFKQMEEWNEDGIKLKVNINISPVQLKSMDFFDKLIKLKENYDVDCNKIVFELTETQMINFEKEKINKLQFLREIGINLSLDDFGKGFSQFINLITLPINEVKIDREITNKIEKDIRVRSIIKSFVNMVNELGYEIVVEGVENKNQFKYLKEMGCSKIQGYYISQPVDSEKILEMIK